MNEKSSYLPSKSPPEDKDQGKRTLVSQSNIHRHEKISWSWVITFVDPICCWLPYKKHIWEHVDWVCYGIDHGYEQRTYNQTL